METKHVTLKQQSSVRCPTCGVAAGKRCILVAGGLRNEPHRNRKLLAAEAVKKKVANKNKDAAALLARFKRELAKPILTKSARESATKKELASIEGRLRFAKRTKAEP